MCFVWFFISWNWWDKPGKNAGKTIAGDVLNCSQENFNLKINVNLKINYFRAFKIFIIYVRLQTD